MVIINSNRKNHDPFIKNGLIAPPFIDLQQIFNVNEIVKFISIHNSYGNDSSPPPRRP